MIKWNSLTKLHKNLPAQAYQTFPTTHQMKKRFASLLVPVEKAQMNDESYFKTIQNKSIHQLHAFYSKVNKVWKKGKTIPLTTQSPKFKHSLIKEPLNPEVVCFPYHGRNWILTQSKNLRASTIQNQAIGIQKAVIKK